jgi:CBS domain-containing protein
MRVQHANVLPESASLREAAGRLIVGDCDVLVATDGNGRLTGVISESCVVRALLSGAAENTEIRSIISHHAPSTTPNTALGHVLPLFRTASVTVVPVVRETGEVCGLLLRRDVIASLMRGRSVLEQPMSRGGTRPTEHTVTTDRAEIHHPHRKCRAGRRPDWLARISSEARQQNACSGRPKTDCSDVPLLVSR